MKTLVGQTAPASKREWPAHAELFVRDDPQRVAVVQIAKTFWSRFLGLLTYRDLPRAEGLLFVPGGSIHTVGMRFPIDVVFLDASMKVVRVVDEVGPWRFVFAPRRTRFVLELKAGSVRETAIREQATLEFD